MAQAGLVIPLDPDWSSVVTALYRRYGTYEKLLEAMGEHNPCDHAQLSRLRSGKCKRPTWQAGAALLNLYTQLRA